MSETIRQIETCVRIEMEFADGCVIRATGDDAEAIRKWMDSAAMLQHVHGMGYTGPTMQKVESGAGFRGKDLDQS
jgi:hypothetical protein